MRDTLMKLRTLKDLPPLNGKRVLLRVDFNVPFTGKVIEDDTRMKAAIPTIKFLLRKNAKLIIVTHLGRPKGLDESLKVDFIAKHLQKLLKKKVAKLDGCIGPDVGDKISRIKPGSVIMLENIRFHPGEERCDLHFTRELASHADFFVNDAFGTCHRKHASTVGVANFIPAYAGFLVEEEMKKFAPLLEKPKRPFTLIMGGAKITDKIGVIKRFFHKANYILVGGGLGNTFLAAEGYDVGRSFFEVDKIELAREIMLMAEKNREKFFLPADAVVADEVTEYARTLDLPVDDVEGSMKILDIGSITRKKYISIINKSKTIVWNGPMGVFEFTPFAGGTKALAEALAKRRTKAKVYLGGGDTIDALTKFKIPFRKFAHVSTGGGAMLEFLEGKELPGIKVLMKD